MRHSCARSPGTAAGRWLLGFMLVVMAFSLAACNRDDNTVQTSDILREYLPEDWKPLADKALQGFLRVNIDGDVPDEWLYFFHYDNQGGNNGPIGGVIYDAQQSREQPQPAALFVPYRLLPDWREDKGQGYLGETTVVWSQARINPNASNVELVVIGYSAGGVPTRLSLFRWQGAERGYGVNHFVGNGGIVLRPTDRSDGSLVREVLTFTKLNDRSRFCERTHFVRQGDEPRFAEDLPSITFCPQAPGAEPTTPSQPTYPEAVVLAWIWGDRPAMLTLNNETNNVLRNQIPDPVRRVVHVQYEGAVPVLLAREAEGIVSEIVVQTVLDTSAGLQTYQWYLVERRADETNRTSRWRIVSAQRIE